MAAIQTAGVDEIIECVLNHILIDAGDRVAISMVCWKWHDLERLTRKSITVSFCYAVTPSMLLSRFPNIKSLKINGRLMKGSPLLSQNWGGYAMPWVTNIHQFQQLNSLQFKRMILSDFDLETIANAKGQVLQALRLYWCVGFSTNGLWHITRSCRNLRTLSMERSKVVERSGEWLHELAVNNTVLETLNIHRTGLENFSFDDLQIIAKNGLLVCLQTEYFQVPNLINILRSAVTLEEFGAGLLDPHTLELVPEMQYLPFPASLHSLWIHGLENMGMPLFFPVVHLLKEFFFFLKCDTGARTPDLQHNMVFYHQATGSVGYLLKELVLTNARLGPGEYCFLLRRCPNLEVLQVSQDIGDPGLQTVAHTCRKLKTLRIVHGGFYMLGWVTYRGLREVARHCTEIEILHVRVFHVTNDVLEFIGSRLKNLCDFRLFMLDKKRGMDEYFPLDGGVRALLLGCRKLRKFGFYVQRGALSDEGLRYIGQHGGNVRWMMLRGAGQSDEGLLALSLGCPKLQKLELIDCFFSGRAIAGAALRLRSLMHLWVDGFPPSTARDDFLPMARPNWIIELIPEDLQLLAYYSFGGRRTDFPEDQSVIPLVLPKVRGHLAAIPCGACPRINYCTPDGVISPSTCKYYDKWLDF